MGSYCGYCDHRCFVYREITFGDGVWKGLMATCKKGMAHDKEATGMTYIEAHNPARYPW